MVVPEPAWVWGSFAVLRILSYFCELEKTVCGVYWLTSGVLGLRRAALANLLGDAVGLAASA